MTDDQDPFAASPSSVPASSARAGPRCSSPRDCEVVATDIAPNAEAALRSSWRRPGRRSSDWVSRPARRSRNLTFTADLPQAVAGVDLVQENGPERIDFKKKLYGQLDELLPPDVIIASSSSGLTMSEIQSGAASHPERCVIAHPFNPPHLIPLVEIVGGQRPRKRRSGAQRNFIRRSGSGRCASTRKCPGMSPIVCRLRLAREVYYLVAEGVVSVADVDTALCWGPGCAGASWAR